MLFTLKVVPQSQFNQWLAQQEKTSSGSTQ
jgi:heme/copper-type cytochrome/quinol oxidase subunit 2